jgi:hypothetical protein
MFLATKKSIKSGFLFGSMGQYVGFPVEMISDPMSAVALYKTFGNMSLEPQWVCFALKSPPIIVFCTHLHRLYILVGNKLHLL